MKKLISIILVTVLVIGVSTVALAWGGGMRRPGRGPAQGRRFNSPNSPEEFLQKELDLTEEQTEKIEKLREDSWDKVEEIREDLIDKQEELYDLYFDKSKEKDEIIKLQNEMNNLRVKITRNRNKLHLQIRDILTADQLEELEYLDCFGSQYGRRFSGSRFRAGGPGMNRNFGGF